MSRGFVGLGLVGAALVIGLVLLGQRGCGRDKSGQRADSVLADTARYRATIRRQDSILRAHYNAKLAEKDSIIGVRDRKVAQLRDSTRRARFLDAEQQKALDAAVASGVPPGTDPVVFFRNAFEEQRRIAGRLRIQVIPQMQRTIDAQADAILTRDEKIALHIAKEQELTDQRDYARHRVNVITAEFQRYRQDSRPGLDLGFVRIPEIVVDVAKVGLGVAAGAVLADEKVRVRQDDRDRPVVSELELN